MTIKTAPTSLDELTNNLLEMEDAQPLSSTERVNLTPANSYYRSQLFTTFHSINPLIAAASPLLAMISKLNKKSSALEYASLHKNLVHEIKAFECQTQNHGYRANTILAARYILCAWADEMVLNTQEKEEAPLESVLEKKAKIKDKSKIVANQKNQSLLQTFQRETCGSDRFFLILERSCEDPVLYIDLLELIYLCLRFGFQGKYKNQAQSFEDLNKITETLYQSIREERGEISKALSSYQPSHPPKSYMHRKLRLITVIPAVFIISSFIIFLAIKIIP